MSPPRRPRQPTPHSATAIKAPGAPTLPPRPRPADAEQRQPVSETQATRPRSPLDVPESAVSAALVASGGNVDHAVDNLLAAQQHTDKRDAVRLWNEQVQWKDSSESHSPEFRVQTELERWKGSRQ
jgi:hypothetical protein